MRYAVASHRVGRLHNQPIHYRHSYIVRFFHQHHCRGVFIHIASLPQAHHPHPHRPKSSACTPAITTFHVPQVDSTVAQGNGACSFVEDADISVAIVSQVGIPHQRSFNRCKESAVGDNSARTWTFSVRRHCMIGTYSYHTMPLFVS